MLTDRQLENRVKKIQLTEKQIQDLQEYVDALKNEIKAEMTERSADEIRTDNFIIRWKKVVTNRLDSKSLKKDFPDIYKAFTKQSETKRFTIA